MKQRVRKLQKRNCTEQKFHFESAKQNGRRKSINFSSVNPCSWRDTIKGGTFHSIISHSIRDIWIFVDTLRNTLYSRSINQDPDFLYGISVLVFQVFNRMFAAVLVLALALSVSAQYGQQVSLQLGFVKKLHFQTPAPAACPQGMTMAPAYGTTCYNGGFYYSGVCCQLPVSYFTMAKKITFSDEHNARAYCVSPGNDRGTSLWNYLLQWWILLQRCVLRNRCKLCLW